MLWHFFNLTLFVFDDSICTCKGGIYVITQKITMENFNKLLDRLRLAVNSYDYSNCKFTRFSLFFANGDRILYSIPEQSIAHLLGVKTDYLSSTSCLHSKSNSSIDVLRALCDPENAYSIYKNISDGILDFDKMFSKYIYQKIDDFESNIKPYINNFEFVCKVDRNKVHYNGVDYMDVSYFICTKDKQTNKFSLIGIVDNGGYYVPRTIMVFDSIDDLKANKSLFEVLNGQEITYCYKIFINSFDGNYSNKVFLNPEGKRDKVQSLVYYRKIFNMSMSIEYDYSFVLGQVINQYNYIKSIVEYMKTGQIIDVSDMTEIYGSIPSMLLEIINSYNNALCGCNNGSYDAGVAFSDLSKRNMELEEETSSLKEESKNLQDRFLALSLENEQLHEELDSYKSCVSEAVKVLTKFKN